MGCIEEFIRNGKSFVYVDKSGFKTNDEYLEFVNANKWIIAKYPEKSLYTITNVEDVRFDSTTKKIMADWVTHNTPYVRYGAMIGVDGAKKLFAKKILSMCERTNVIFSFSKEDAIEQLLRLE
jgi:hypothetical protein